MIGCNGLGSSSTAPSTCAGTSETSVSCTLANTTATPTGYFWKDATSICVQRNTGGVGIAVVPANSKTFTPYV